MVAAASDHADTAMLQVLIAHGADVNALTQRIPPPDFVPLDDEARAVLEEAGMNPSLVEDAHRETQFESVLGYAARAAAYDKIVVLLESGADAQYVDKQGYSVLLNAMYRQRVEPREEWEAVLRALIDAGAPLDAQSPYGESPLRVAYRNVDLRIMSLLLERGADPEPLGWTPLFQEIAAGNVAAVASLADDADLLNQRDVWERTPFLFAVHAGQLEIAKLLLSRGIDRSATGRCGKTAPMYAISRDETSMLRWLIAMGWDVEEPDEFGYFPLLHAAQEDAAGCLQLLLDAGASVERRTEQETGAIHDAASPRIVRLLVAAGEELSHIDSEMRKSLLHAESADDADLTEEDYRRHRHRVFGQGNPEKMNNVLWDMMVRSRMTGYACASKYDDRNLDREPVWSFQRFGQSLTELPDGRYVEIAGEHEDHYHPDFCIYNDVVVHHGNGTFDIFGYPVDVFPPTDFHSATLVWPHIYIIGNLGYPRQRKPHETPVYRLHCETWAIERVDCKGDLPGWIHRHRARPIGNEQIAIRGGLIDDGSRRDFVKNTDKFVLDLSAFQWKRGH